jgi:hypothetical protein
MAEGLRFTDRVLGARPLVLERGPDWQSPLALKVRGKVVSVQEREDGTVTIHHGS